jgi:pyruvate/2-oxoacid:ferredoxin oxidoreductase beta subunit
MKLQRRAAMAALVKDRGDDLLIVPGLGSTTWDLAATGDDPRNFYLWGAMGGAGMVGLGLALAQPKRPVAVIVFDNGLYGETGGQPSHTQSGVDLATVARGAGFPIGLDVTDEKGLGALAARLKDFHETLFARVAIKSDEPPRVLPERDGVAIKKRFRAALGLEA